MGQKLTVETQENVPGGLDELYGRVMADDVSRLFGNVGAEYSMRYEQNDKAMSLQSLQVDGEGQRQINFDNIKVQQSLFVQPAPNSGVVSPTLDQGQMNMAPSQYSSGEPLKFTMEMGKVKDVEKEGVVDGKKILQEAKEQAIQKLEVKREIKEEIEAQIQYGQQHDIPIEQSLQNHFLDGIEDMKELQFQGIDKSTGQVILPESQDAKRDDISETLGNGVTNKDFKEWKKNKAKNWYLQYTREPKMKIDHDDYDKILINLLQSYLQFKQKLNDLELFYVIQQDRYPDFQNTVEKIAAKTRIPILEAKRKPKTIRMFYHKIFESMQVRHQIEDVNLDVEEFKRYVSIVSNKEIELVHGGDASELREYLQILWGTLLKIG